MGILDTACRYLSYRDRSEQEMQEYLEKKEFSEEEIAQAMASLKEMHYLDDIRFAKQYLRYSLEKRRGMFRIRGELRKKGISDYDIEDAMALFEEEEEITIAEAERIGAEKTAQSVMSGKPIDQKLLARLARRLQSQGFDSSVVYEILGEYRNKMQKDENEEY